MMTSLAIQWDEDFSLEDPQLDDDHRRLVGVLNSLAACVDKGVGFDVINDMYADLVRHTLEHFKREELYFDEIQYPAAREHVQRHREFTEHLARLPALLTMEDQQSLRQFAQNLHDLANEHLSVDDRKLVQFVKANRLAGKTMAACV